MTEVEVVQQQQQQWQQQHVAPLVSPESLLFCHILNGLVGVVGNRCQWSTLSAVRAMKVSAALAPRARAARWSESS